MKLSSESFSDNEILPQKYTCDSIGKSPNLSWSNFPSNTKSFALIFEDPDAPSGTFAHWIIANIPPSITSIPEETVSIAEATMIENDGGKSDYFPPCPPSGIHQYIFKIFALNTENIDGINRNNFYEKIKPYIIDEGKLQGDYSRNE